MRYRLVAFVMAVGMALALSLEARQSRQDNGPPAAAASGDASEVASENGLDIH